MNNKILPLIGLVLLSYYYGFSQVGIGTTNPDSSSILELQSSTQGFLPPRLTTTQMNAISPVAEGLFVYNLDDRCFKFYKGTGWSDCLGEIGRNKLDCGSVQTHGSYLVGSALTTSNTITVDVLVNSIDTYNITTNTVNGYSFSASGTFTSVGVNTITLYGTGTPNYAQTDNFTIDFTGTGYTCNASVNVISAPLANCLDYLNAGHNADGIYTIDPDGSGGNAPYDCYCDMTNDGGGWTLVFNHNTNGNTNNTYLWTDDTEASEYNVASPGLSTDKYSILSRLDDIKSNTAYEFRLYYPSLGLRNHWSQTFDPRSTASTTRPVAGYVGISIEMNQRNWGGLERSGGNTYLDGSVNSGNWYYSIGSSNIWNGGIPSNQSAVYSVQLYVR